MLSRSTQHARPTLAFTRLEIDLLNSTLDAARIARGLQIQEDLDVVLGELEAQLLAAVDVWRAVKHRLHKHITIRMQLRIPLKMTDCSAGT